MEGRGCRGQRPLGVGGGYRLLVRIRQYAYFALFSEHMSAAEMTGLIGVEPDSFGVLGARRHIPRAVPVAHSWRAQCRDAGLTVDEQVERVVARLLPYQTRIARLAAQLAHESVGGARLSVVRYFNDDEGEDELLSEPDAPLQKLPGQHQLLGWHLSARVLGFLVTVGADLDVDEYG